MLRATLISDGDVAQERTPSSRPEWIERIMYTDRKFRANPP